MRLYRFFRFAPAIVAAAAAMTFAAPASAAGGFTLLHSFCKQDSCADGGGPTGTLLMDSAHNLYGTTANGGAHGGGTAFELVFIPSTGKYHYKVLYNFCLLSQCADGESPQQEKLIMDTAGNIYGTTSGGGSTKNGTIFRLVPNAAKTRYTLETLYNFCERLSGCEDGSTPNTGLTYAGAASGVLYDGTSTLYGSTIGGGRRHEGVVYSFAPTQHPGEWIQRVLYFFCTTGGQACSDGRNPTGDMVVDSHGNLIGTTFRGGSGDNGVVYRLTPTTKGHWAESVLYTFCSQANCSDGAGPERGVIIDGAGSIFGTTDFGGNMDAGQCPTGCGVIFKITPNGTESRLYAFCTQTDCADGAKPAGLVMDPGGILYGATQFGGADKNGAIYSFLDSTQAVLYNVKCNHQSECRNGNTPTGSMVLNSAGDLFGLFFDGGRFGTGGTAFKLTPGGS